MQDHNLHLPSTQEFKFISLKILHLPPGYQPFIFSFMYFAIMPLCGKEFKAKPFRKQTGKRHHKSVAPSLPHRNVTLEICAGLCAQAMKSLSASHELSKVYVKGH